MKQVVESIIDKSDVRSSTCKQKEISHKDKLSDNSNKDRSADAGNKDKSSKRGRKKKAIEPVCSGSGMNIVVANSEECADTLDNEHCLPLKKRHKLLATAQASTEASETAATNQAAATNQTVVIADTSVDYIKAPALEKRKPGRPRKQPMHDDKSEKRDVLVSSSSTEDSTAMEVCDAASVSTTATVLSAPASSTCEAQCSEISSAVNTVKQHSLPYTQQAGLVVQQAGPAVSEVTPGSVCTGSPEKAGSSIDRQLEDMQTGPIAVSELLTLCDVGGSAKSYSHGIGTRDPTFTASSCVATVEHALNSVQACEVSSQTSLDRLSVGVDTSLAGSVIEQGVSTESVTESVMRTPGTTVTIIRAPMEDKGIQVGCTTRFAYQVSTKWA